MAGLTTRQQEVLALLVDGQSTKDIAKSLNLGIGTVKVHLGGIYRSLAVRNRAEAVARFHNGGYPGLPAPVRTAAVRRGQEDRGAIGE
jgi:DNA-binding NarL/FixJ family response regulator